MESMRFVIERNVIKKNNIGLKQLFHLKSSRIREVHDPKVSKSRTVVIPPIIGNKIHVLKI